MALARHKNGAWGCRLLPDARDDGTSTCTGLSCAGCCALAVKGMEGSSADTAVQQGYAAAEGLALGCTGEGVHQMVLSLLALVTSSSVAQAQAKHRWVRRGVLHHSIVQSTLIEAAEKAAQL